MISWSNPNWTHQSSTSAVPQELVSSVGGRRANPSRCTNKTLEEGILSLKVSISGMSQNIGLPWGSHDTAPSGLTSPEVWERTTWCKKARLEMGSNWSSLSLAIGTTVRQAAQPCAQIPLSLLSPKMRVGGKPWFKHLYQGSSEVFDTSPKPPSLVWRYMHAACHTQQVWPGSCFWISHMPLWIVA